MCMHTRTCINYSVKLLNFRITSLCASQSSYVNDLFHINARLFLPESLPPCCQSPLQLI